MAVGQKSGFSCGLRWSGAVGPVGIFGGIEWGTATDGKRIYVAISNSFHVPTKLINRQTTANGGLSEAFDAATGKILWLTANPDDAAGYGSVSEGERRDVWRFFVRQDVCSRCEDGKILWHFATKGSVIDGPSIVHGILNWGSGYGRVSGTPHNILYAFTVLQSSE